MALFRFHRNDVTLRIIRGMGELRHTDAHRLIKLLDEIDAGGVITLDFTNRPEFGPGEVPAITNVRPTGTVALKDAVEHLRSKHPGSLTVIALPAVFAQLKAQGADKIEGLDLVELKE
jgi:hypothetical protein